MKTDNLCVYAARYARTRRTGAALQVVTMINSIWDGLADGVKNQLIRETKEEAVYCLEDWALLGKGELKNHWNETHNYLLGIGDE